MNLKMITGRICGLQEEFQKSSLSNFFLPWSSKTVVWQGEGVAGTGISKGFILGYAPKPIRAHTLALPETVIFTSPSNRL